MVWEKKDECEGRSVVVGELCGLAVLRGADVFAPGVLAMSPDLRIGERWKVLSCLLFVKCW